MCLFLDEICAKTKKLEGRKLCKKNILYEISNRLIRHMITTGALEISKKLKINDNF